MRYAVLTILLFACGGEPAASSEPAPAEAASAGSEEAAAPAEASTPPCQRNSSQVCECPSGGTALRVCLEGTWTDCPCDDVDDFDDGFGPDEE